MAIDTLKLRLNDWSIRKGANLSIKGGTLSYNTGEIKERLLFRDDTGRDLRGSGAYLNTEKWNFDISPLRENVFTFVQFSLPKQINETNYSEIPESEIAIAFESVEKSLSENGIETEIDNAHISRLDYNKDINPDESVESYARLFSLLQANRSKSVKTYGVNGWLFSNKRAEYCIYDKLEEMQMNHHCIEGLPKTLRFEHRCLTSDKTKEFYGFTTVDELKKYGFDALREKQSLNWKENFFKYDLEDFKCLVGNELRMQLQYFMARNGRNYFEAFLKWQGAYLIATSYGGIDIIKRELMNLGCERLKLYRADKFLKESVLIAEQLSPTPINKKSITELYNELKEKVCYET